MIFGFIMIVLIVYGVKYAFDCMAPNKPEIKDKERFLRESIGMSTEEKKQAIKDGRWS